MIVAFAGYYKTRGKGVVKVLKRSATYQSPFILGIDFELNLLSWNSNGMFHLSGDPHDLDLIAFLGNDPLWCVIETKERPFRKLDNDY